jgi:hypothetical protein
MAQIQETVFLKLESLDIKTLAQQKKGGLK